MTVSSFQHTMSPGHVVFGPGTLSNLREEALRLGIERALVITTVGQRHLGEIAREHLGEIASAVFSEATMHTPVEVTERALESVALNRIDGLVALGGGSAIGLSKALAYRTDLPQVVVPTTYAGSEASSILGETKDGKKTTQRSPRVLPETIIYDVNLSSHLPIAVSMTSGINAMAHAVEALYAPDGNPLVSRIAEGALATMIEALPRIHKQPHDFGGRSDALYGAWLSSICLGSVSMGLHHKICHTLGGSFGLPHGETHAVMLPYALAYNLGAAPDAYKRLVGLLGDENPAAALERFAIETGVPRALRDIGMPEQGLEEVADLAIRNPYANPRPVERGAIRIMLQRAWAGVGPGKIFVLEQP